MTKTTHYLGCRIFRNATISYPPMEWLKYGNPYRALLDKKDETMTHPTLTSRRNSPCPVANDNQPQLWDSVDIFAAR